ncbi:hypothetical protein E6H28_02555 [Candidatus Bathyarchaeota archaeon]|nr:MAG: hypothetical protein E6H28_02555 [Candidatus Bathyarchaeota archaeon]TMI53202.1 MAG: hypothetical protein E6H13_04540 [Candidatus Bathyarchaeota archaeon]
MAPPKTLTDPRALKRKVSSQILQLPGVSGIGVPKGQLTVYLESDSEDIKDRVREVLKTVSPESDVVFLVLGKFAKQDSD